MAIVKVSIKDKNTLVLQEDAKKGDIIDLASLSGADVSMVTDAMRTQAKKEVALEMATINQREIEAALLKKEKELSQFYMQRLSEKDKAMQEVAITKQKIESEMQVAAYKAKQSESLIREEYERQLRIKDDEFKTLKDNRLNLNSKMLGETLEKHCDLAFEQIRGFLPCSVQFNKDTNISEGSAGDRIYREFSENGEEVLSIMFEMKNEHDTTKTKQKNEQFFKELDKDRRQKNCEYAVLVTMLEKENERYDNIYTVSEDKYKDMFVIRPQHFIPIIQWLRNVSRKMSATRGELALIKNREVDITNFDSKVAAVRDKFNKHVEAAHERHREAIEEIDKSIKSLTKMREKLTRSSDNWRYASDDLENFTAKKMAKDSPGLLEQLNNEKKRNENQNK